MTSKFSSQQSTNIKLLEKVDPAIPLFLEGSSIVKIRESIDIEDDFVVFDDSNSVIYKNIVLQAEKAFESWKRKPSRVLSPRIKNESKANIVDFSRVPKIVKDTIGNQNGVILDSLPLNSSVKNLHCRHLILVGSIHLLKIKEYLASDPNLIALTVLEPNPIAFKAALSLIDLQDILSFVKSKNIGFEVLIDTDLRRIQHRLCLSMANQYTLSYHGVSITTPSIDCQASLEIHQWLVDSTGFSTRISQMLGSDCDEYAHLYNAFSNICCAPSIKLLKRNALDAFSNYPVILTGSGPSLSDHIAEIKSYESNCFVFAAGSSVGTLLHNNIKVDAVVLLERSNAVYQDLLELRLSGYKLDSIVLIASISIDPRISNLFQDTIYFLRPLSSATTLINDYTGEYTLLQAGPQSTNAAIEVVGHLGLKSIYAVGCDFGSLSKSFDRDTKALGFSARNLDLARNSRKNKLLYTNSGLISCSEYFFNSVENYCLDLYITDDGLQLQNSDLIHVIDNLSLSLCNAVTISSEPIKFYEQFKDNDDRSILSTAIQVLENSLVTTERYFEELREVTLATTFSGIDSYRKICGLVNPICPLSSHNDVLARRLNLLSIFYVYQALYDDPEDIQSQKNSLNALNFLLDLTNNFIQSLIRLSQEYQVYEENSITPFELGPEVFSAISVLFAKGVFKNEIRS